MKVKIPTRILDEILSYIKIDESLYNSKEKDQQKFIKVLVELWVFIYDKQINDTEISNLKGYTNIHRSDLKRFNVQISGSRYEYSDLLKVLSISDLISINDKYSQGSFSKGYRIEMSSVTTDNLSEIEIDFDKVFCNNYNKSFWLDKYPKLSNLIEDAYNTTIDLDAYVTWINNNIGIELKPIIKNGKLCRRWLSFERAYHHIFLALKVNMKNLWFKLSDEGRFYSSLSNLPAGSVPFIKLYGCSTCNIDIKNCQPLLLSSLLSNEKFSLDTQNGTFYDNVAREYGCSRDEFKVLSYKYIFFGSKTLKSGKLYNAMEKLYSGLIDEINSIKEKECLAKKLQQIESDIIVKKIGKVKMFKVLRHDEVLVIKENADDIKRYLRKEFSKYNLNILIS